MYKRQVQDYLRRGPAGEGEPPGDELTPREQEVLTLIAQLSLIHISEPTRPY